MEEDWTKWAGKRKRNVSLVNSARSSTRRFVFFVYSPERMRATRFCKVGLLRYANDPHATQKRIDDQKEIIVSAVSDDLRITENDKRGGGMLRDIYP